MKMHKFIPSFNESEYRTHLKMTYFKFLCRTQTKKLVCMNFWIFWSQMFVAELLEMIIDYNKLKFKQSSSF